MLRSIVFFLGQLAAFLAVVTVALHAGAADGEAGLAGRKVQVELLSATTAIEPGKPFVVGLRQSITPNWHTYWKNPGDSGEPTRMTWRLPDGFNAGDIQWPMPEAIPVGPLMNFGYSNDLLLPVTVTPPATIEADAVTLTADAEWLVCEKICIPESETVSLTLPVARAGEASPSDAADLFAAQERAQPVDLGWTGKVGSEGDSGRLTLRVLADDLDPSRLTGVRFFPEEWGLVEHAAEQPVRFIERGFEIGLQRGELVTGDVAPALSGVVVLTEKTGGEMVRNAVSIKAQPAADGALPAVAAAPGAAPSGVGGADAGLGLVQAMLFALIGGAILNLMPCVLPILSLKVMALAGHGGREGTRSGVAYLAGVLASFALLAVLLIALKAAGQSLGWGFQFQSPGFVLGMVALFFALGLAMSGVFDIGGGLVGAGDSLTRRSGTTGSFFTGVLASVAATPCTAPFMGAAVGYALTRSGFETLAVLLALGLGFGLPVLILSVSGAAQRVLPRPGPWMERLKQLLAFPLYATVAWLVWVLSQQSGSDGVLAAGLVLVVVGFAAWLAGQPTGRPRLRIGLAAAIAGATVFVALGLLGAPPEGGSRGSTTAAVSARDIDGAGRFSPGEVERIRREGRAVFVNLTAAWCISCKVNERVALASEGFRQGLERHDIAYLKGDWTNKNDEIAAVLESFGRAGVPLYLLYPADRSAEPIVLPQLLTEGIVLSHFASLSKTLRGSPSNHD